MAGGDACRSSTIRGDPRGRDHAHGGLRPLRGGAPLRPQAALAENSRLESERKILRILQRAEEQTLSHSRLLCKSKITSREFRSCMESLIERQAVVCHEKDIGYRNRIGIHYALNPVLNELEIN